MQKSNVELEGSKRKLLLRGKCLDLLPLCEAMCCREWEVAVSPEEYASGLYQAEAGCRVTQGACTHKEGPCRNRSYALSRTPDGTCTHLGSDHRCTIYETRPRVCREFTCQGGWRLASVFAWPERARVPAAPMTKADFIARLSDDMTFVPHPLIKLCTIFYRKDKDKDKDKDKREVIFVKKIVGGCAMFNTRDDLHHPLLTEAHLLALADLFNRKDSLGVTLRSFRGICAVDLAQQDFFELVWLLNRHHIILESTNFQGMLRGVDGK